MMVGGGLLPSPAALVELFEKILHDAK